MYIVDDIKTIAKEAGIIMMTAKAPKIMEKEGHSNLCTETDEKIQAFSIGRLHNILNRTEN